VVFFREPSLQLMAEYTTAGRGAVDQKHRKAALAALLGREGPVRGVESVPPSRNTHMRCLRLIRIVAAEWYVLSSPLYASFRHRLPRRKPSPTPVMLRTICVNHELSAYTRPRLVTLPDLSRSAPNTAVPKLDVDRTTSSTHTAPTHDRAGDDPIIHLKRNDSAARRRRRLRKQPGQIWKPVSLQLRLIQKVSL
jgi:hypothetical protein